MAPVLQPNGGAVQEALHPDAAELDVVRRPAADTSPVFDNINRNRSGEPALVGPAASGTGHRHVPQIDGRVAGGSAGATGLVTQQVSKNWKRF